MNAFNSFMKHTTEQMQHMPADRDLLSLWKEIEQSVKTFYMEYTKRHHDESDEEYMEKVEEKIDGEKYFFQEVLHGAEVLAGDSEHTKSVILFDIDDTIGKPVFDREGNFSGTILRPTLLPLLENIKEKFPAMEIGFLTTRSKEGVVSQLEDEHQLASLKKFISADRIYSVARQEVYMSTDEQSEFVQKSPIVNQEHVTEETGWYLHPGDILKLKMLEELNANEPATSVLAVDDFSYAGLLKNGVSVHTKGRFSLN